MTGTALKTSLAKRSAVEWHKSLNHLSMDRLKLMLRNKMAEGIEISGTIPKECSCTACFMGKSKQVLYPSISERKLDRIGHVISVDGFGPLKPDLNGNRYFMAFLDHFSGKSFVYLYRTPADVKNIVLSFLKEVHTQTGMHVKYFRADKEGGYTSNIVQKYCKDVGTLIENTLTEAHQQNGRSENYNLHALEAVRTMLVQSGLPNSLWGEAVLNYNYTRNKLPTSGRDQSPEAIWFGTKPNIKHLRAFGEPCVAHIMPAKQLSKIHPRGSMCHFLGYDTNTKAYRLYDTNSKSIFLSRSVQFYHNPEWPKPIFNRFDDNPLLEQISDDDRSTDLDYHDGPMDGVTPTLSLFNSFQELQELPGDEQSISAEVLADDVVSVPRQPISLEVSSDHIVGDPSKPVQTRSRHRVLVAKAQVSQVMEPPEHYGC